MENIASTSRATTVPTDEQKLALADLPSGILTRIFGCLEVQDLGSVARCSRRMKKIADADVVWKSLFLRRFAQPALPIEGVKGQYAARADSERQEELRDMLKEQLKDERPNAVALYFSLGGRWYKRKHGMTLITILISMPWHSSREAFLSNLDACLDRARTTDPTRRIWDPALNTGWVHAISHGTWMIQALLERGFNPEAGSVPGCLHCWEGSILQVARALAQSEEMYQPLVDFLEDAVRQRRERG